MFDRFLSVLTKIGILAEGTALPRRLKGGVRVAASIISVAFSYFFIHISFFGQPIAEIFKGTFILGTSVLCLLFFKGRRRPIREGFNWLDEIFSFLAITATLSLFSLWLYWFFFDNSEQWRNFIGTGASLMALLGAFIGGVIYWKEATRTKVGESFLPSDLLYLLSAVIAVNWWAYNNNWLETIVGTPALTEFVIFTGIFSAMSFEIARRVVGPTIPLIGFLFLIYTFEPIARLSPGLLNHGGFSMDRIAEFLLLHPDGMTGFIIDIFATYVVIFVILGAFLEKTGIGALFIDATFRLTGTLTGGPGLTAVAASGLFGMISGSGVANAVTTGTFTIPLMKRVGYRAEFAGAVEAAASTGGGYMPPIMGSGAFLLAQFTGISYFEVIKIAAIPATLYFLSVGYMVYVRAARRGLHGVPVSELPAWSTILPRLYLLLPIPAMVYYLLNGDSAFLAAFKTIILIIILKAADLFSAIHTPWSMKLKNPFLGFSFFIGVFTYFFGTRVGPPFSLFTPDYRSVNLGDALFWGFGVYLALRLGEIIWAGFRTPANAENPTEEGNFESGTVLFSRLRECLVALVKETWSSLEAGATNSLVIGSIACVLGILLSCANQSDLPGRVSLLLVELSFGLLPLTIFWVIVAGYIVGMGLPIPAAYVILIIFGVISLTSLGVPVLVAHFLCYWVSVVSAVTPPVAITAYAASAIANSDPVKTSLQAIKLASWILIMPFLFVYTPLLLQGTWPEIIITTMACLLGIVTWAGMLEGYLVERTNLTEWILMAAASACLLLPVDRLITFTTNFDGELRYPVYLAGSIFLGVGYFSQIRRRKAA